MKHTVKKDIKSERERERNTRTSQNYAFYAERRVKLQQLKINTKITFFYAFYAIFYKKRR
jgi:hypothetical protein